MINRELYVDPILPVPKFEFILEQKVLVSPRADEQMHPSEQRPVRPNPMDRRTQGREADAAGDDENVVTHSLLDWP